MAPARRALETIAAKVGWRVEDVADGAIRVATALMTAEASSVLARRGVDAPHFRMVAFGGAGPLMAALLAEEIAIDAILVPPRPGALSALGAARADLEGDLVQPIYERLGKLAKNRLADALHDIETQAQAWIAEQTSTLPVTATAIEIAADMRYDGQGYDVTVPLQSTWLAENDAGRIAGAFHDAHRATYGHAAEEAEVWLKELRAHIVGVMPRPRILPMASTPEPGPPSSRQVRLFGSSFEAAVLERDNLAPGRRIDGPAIVNQMDTTTLIPAGWHASTVASGALIVARTAAKKDQSC
jgi:N-methylhydantoinase A